MRAMSFRRRRGAALISALLTVAVAIAGSASLAVAAQGWLRQVESAGERAQANALVLGGLDWACELLTAKARLGGADSLGDPWARPIGPVPLGPGRLRIEITDAQSRFNLNSLETGGARSGADVELFRRLLAALKLNGGLADAAAARVLAAGPLDELEDLQAVYGATPEVLERLQPWVTALPEPTTVNINTAPRELLQALFPDLDDDAVDRLLLERRAKPLQDGPRAESAGGDSEAELGRYGIESSYFFVRATGEAGRVELTARALVRRPINGEPAQVLWRSDER